MKVKCYNCGLVLEKGSSYEGICPECGFTNWYPLPEEKMKEKIDKEMLEMREDLVRMRDIAKKWVESWDNLKKQEDFMRDPLKQQREPEKEGLMFEIFEYFNGKKTQVRKIYLDGHIEGFKGDPCVANHILPKILALKDLLRQMNKDYRDLIEAYTMRGLPLEQVPLHELYIREMEGIENIKI
jgi:predicted  nucleic acid-binding Zn-ribbon protein